MPHHKHLAETANIINLTTLSSCTNGVTFSDAVQPHSQYVATMTGNIPSVFFFFRLLHGFPVTRQTDYPLGGIMTANVRLPENIPPLIYNWKELIY